MLNLKLSEYQKLTRRSAKPRLDGSACQMTYAATNA